MPPNSPKLSPNAKAIIALSLLALANVTTVTTIILIDNFTIPPVPGHPVWDIKSCIKDWMHGIESAISRLYSTYLQLAHFLTTHTTLSSFGHRETAITALSAVVIMSWIFALSFLTNRETREAVRSSRFRRLAIAILLSSNVPIVSIMIWGYIPSPVFGLTGLTIPPWNGAFEGDGVKRGDEEALKGTVDMDVGQEKV